MQRLNVPTKTRRGNFHIIIENKEEKGNIFFFYFGARRGKTGLRKFNFVFKWAKPSKKLEHLMASFNKCSSCKILRVWMCLCHCSEHSCCLPGLQGTPRSHNNAVLSVCLLQPSTTSPNSFGLRLSSLSPSSPLLSYLSFLHRIS